MKTQDNRVLSYQLATSIPYAELDNISGGSGSKMSMQQTTKVIGDSAHGTTVSCDVNIDW